MARAPRIARRKSTSNPGASLPSFSLRLSLIERQNQYTYRAEKSNLPSFVCGRHSFLAGQPVAVRKFGALPDTKATAIIPQSGTAVRLHSCNWPPFDGAIEESDIPTDGAEFF